MHPGSVPRCCSCACACACACPHRARDDRIEVVSGEITSPSSTCKLSTAVPQKIVLANPCNFRLKGNVGDPINKEINKAAGSVLEALAKAEQDVRACVRVHKRECVQACVHVPSVCVWRAGTWPSSPSLLWAPSLCCTRS